MQKMKFDFDDILIIPSDKTRINSRSQINIFDDNNMLPIFTAPMDTVIDITNYDFFEKNGIMPIIPRIQNPDNSWYRTDKFLSYSLEDFERIFLSKNEINLPKNYIIKALVDVANGHMPIVKEMIIRSKKKYGDQIVLMVGNVANPQTYVDLSNCGADYVRIGIGNGGGCLTTQQTGIGYPMASLIQETYEISCTLKNPAKIVADGGFKKYADIIKALALGADYVMLGSIFNKALESSGETYRANVKHEYGTEPGEKVDQFDPQIVNYFSNGGRLFKKFRGMSTKEVQISLGNSVIKTSEGIVRMQPVEYTIAGWVENFKDYLKSAMSYTDAIDLTEFIGKVECAQISQNSYNRYNK